MNSARAEVKKHRRRDGIAEYHVVGAQGWDDCASLVRFVVKEFGAEVLSQQDGICSREWVLRIGSVQVQLKHEDDIGNFFYSDAHTAESGVLLDRIASELTLRLSRLQ